MIVVVYIIVVLCMLSMFVVRRSYKIAIIILTEMVFMLVKVPYLPYGMANYLVPLCFLLSELPSFPKLMKLTRHTIVSKLILLFLFSVFVTFVFSPHLHELAYFRSFFRSSVLFTYFLLLYSFWCYSSEKSLKPTLRLSLVGLVFITVVGIVNYVTKRAGWIDFVMRDQMMVGDLSSSDFAARFMFDDRFRNQSVFPYAFDYGFCCVSMLLLHFYAFCKKLECVRNVIIAVLCCLFGVFTCGCRTVLFCTMLSSFYYLAIFKGLKKTTLYVSVFIFVFLIGCVLFPFLGDSFGLMLTMFDDSAGVGGSSINGRLVQLFAVIDYLKDNFLFGKGMGFFSVDLNGVGAAKDRLNTDLQGLESVTFNYLLERGFVGLMLYAAFWILGFFYVYKSKNVDRATSALGCSLIVVYILFANMTGELHSLLFVLPLLGYVFRRLTRPQMTVRIDGKLFRIYSKILGTISNKISFTHSLR